MKAVIQEIGAKTDQETEGLQEEVRQLQDRETEAIEMLSTLEKEHGALTAERAAVTPQLNNLQHKSDKEKAVAAGCRSNYSPFGTNN